MNYSNADNLCAKYEKNLQQIQKELNQKHHLTEALNQRLQNKEKRIEILLEEKEEMLLKIKTLHRSPKKGKNAQNTTPKKKKPKQQFPTSSAKKKQNKIRMLEHYIQEL